MSNSFIEKFVTQLGFVLTIDGCARGCRHCRVFGSTAPVHRITMLALEDRLKFLSEMRVSYGLGSTCWDTVHCWRGSDPLDFTARLPYRGGVATAADVATLWREYLHQGLYVVTNGSEGRRYAQRALRAFAAVPRLVSQVKLTITPEDTAWGTAKYIKDMAADLRILLPLWDIPVDRIDGNLDDRRLRLNVKSTTKGRPDARNITADIMRAAGVTPARIETWLDDPRRVAFKPIYDLGTATDEPSPVDGAVDITSSGERRKPSSRAQMRYGIRPNGDLFEVDMFAFTENDLLNSTTGRPLNIDMIRAAVTRTGWA